MRKVCFVDTTMRDAHQSLLATRVTTSELAKIAPLVDQVGYHAVEVWGGATFDSCVRYLDEDPWERLDVLKEKFKKTKLQMLLRGQNLLGYRNYADDVVELFVKTMSKHGIDVVRIFDALNDFRNLEQSAKAIKASGMHLQVAMSYTTSPVHNIDYFVEISDAAVELGADSLCIKDMAGLLKPGTATTLVNEIKKRHPIPLEVHSHFTTGIADMTYLKSAEAGADILDTATSSMGFGTSQPGVESIWTALHDVGLADRPDYPLLKEINDYFAGVRRNHSGTDAGFTINTSVLENQIPGGMYSNLINQLKSQNMSDKFEEVLDEVPRVRADLGYPPLVTPTSQIVGVQAVLNVMNKERYKTITKEVERYIKGFYGSPPAEIEKSLKSRVMGVEESISHRPGDTLDLEVEKGRSELGLLAQNDEDLLIYLLLGEVGKKFLAQRYQNSLRVDFDVAKDFKEGITVYPV
ncbi:MAG: pyruvate carboxylase subunit B [Mesotoga sp.]|uniref:pyruvate carboxylase subunit B n=2 Tax=Mesotoga sp. TaxID=2053577 RepID=UPI0016A62BB3|nr:pyruvate carboxylase subunit B [Mesotoga sp.]MDI9368383.1 pyruvate carboxylase subunit B [Thermotogota bacterium]NLT44745.1 pyruvate carboxylase subunit B [Thermotogaceae bacterium]MDD2333280.1 pyruvate carboxylase subunit B [Mesotoga sp.]MDD3680259.1 pyruvate carboxylase subunit B [Mesotoga sp.]MDD4206810.1 pyruvate carboxylase subunit B [Mesotoga sp.]